MPTRMRRHVPTACLLSVLAMAAACTPPEVASVPISEAARTAPPPRLAPTASFDAALAGAAPDARALEDQAADLAARAAALRARAAGLAGPVLPTDSRLDPPAD